MIPKNTIKIKIIAVIIAIASPVAGAATPPEVMNECLTAAVYYRDALSNRLSGIDDVTTYSQLEKKIGNRQLAGVITMSAYETKLSDTYGEIKKDEKVLEHGKGFYFYCVDNFNDPIGRFTYMGHKRQP
jgi:hypothetical protein